MTTHKKMFFGSSIEKKFEKRLQARLACKEPA